MCGTPVVRAAVTVYGQVPLGLSSAAAAAAYTPAAEYDSTVLMAPPVPSPATSQFAIQLQSSASDVIGLSIPHGGSFWGFSIEFSVINQVRELLL
jgi:hypothetical protein